MVIQHNISAMNSQRNLKRNQGALSGNLEKLSSGFQINRSADNAAGLAVSEKMRWQITGLGAAQSNVKDGISLINVGEGAMQEIHNIINRMKELAVYSANGTFDDEVDRNAMQLEVDELIEEINRIADSTNFNGIYLLDGSTNNGPSFLESQGMTLDDFVSNYSPSNGDGVGFDNITSSSGNSYPITTTTNTAYPVDGSLFTNLGLFPPKDLSITFTDSSGNTQTVDTTFYSGSDLESMTINLQTSLQNAGVDVDVYSYDGELFFEFYDSGTVLSSVTVNGTTIDEPEPKYVVSETVDLSGFNNGDTITIDGTTYMLVTTDSNITVPSGVVAVTNGASDGGFVVDENFVGALNNAGANVFVEFGTTVVSSPVKVYTDGEALQEMFSDKAFYGCSGLILQIGETSDEYNQLVVPIFDMHASCLSIDPFDISNQDAALYSIAKAITAVNSVSMCRSVYGAESNRLESTYDILCTMEENIQDAESLIRDTDMAEEMMKYVKNNILIESSQSMLAHASSLPEGVLQLLQ